MKTQSITDQQSSMVDDMYSLPEVDIEPDQVPVRQRKVIDIVMSWNDVKNKYMEFHRIDKFTENMAIDIDFGFWLINSKSQPIETPMNSTKGEGG